MNWGFQVSPALLKSLTLEGPLLTAKALFVLGFSISTWCETPAEVGASLPAVRAQAALSAGAPNLSRGGLW